MNSDYEKAKADFKKTVMESDNKLLKTMIMWLGAVTHELDKKNERVGG